MTKSKKTKRALLSSALALVLCFVMLLGTTFAWFTDTASTGVNKIQAGTLKVDIVDKAGTSVNGQTLNFLVASEEGEEGEEDEDGTESKEILWEPNCTYTLPAVKVVNNGNLALKFKVVFTPVVDDEHKGGEKLAEVLEVLVNGENTGLTLKDVLESTDFDGVLHGNLLPKDKTDTVNGKKLSSTSAEYTVSLHMKETAGNEYQGLCIDAIAVTVYATQWTYEYDSINNTYDEDATLPGSDVVPVSSVEDLSKVLEKGENGVLTSDMTNNSGDLIISSEESINFSGNGNTITISGADSEEGNHGYLGFVSDSVTVEDLTVTGEGFVELGDYGDQGGTYTAENLVLKDMKSTLEIRDKGNTLGVTFMQYGTGTLKNCTMTGATAAEEVTPVDIGFGNGTTTIVEGGEYGVAYCWSHSTVTIEDAKIGTMYAAPINGSVTIKSGTTVEKIVVDYGTSTKYATAANLKKLVIKDGAEVSEIVYGNNTYDVAGWNSYVSSLS